MGIYYLNNKLSSWASSPKLVRLVTYRFSLRYDIDEFVREERPLRRETWTKCNASSSPYFPLTSLANSLAFSVGTMSFSSFRSW